jgi:spermidine/putrescine transport system substrate-binding protein
MANQMAGRNRFWTRRLTRRRLLTTTALGAAGLATAALVGCGDGGDGGDGGANGLSGPLNFSNWPYYIDDKTNGDFKDEFGVEVKYDEGISGNNEFFAIIQPDLAAGNDIGRDIIVLSDWLVGRMIGLGYLEELDKTNIPNWENMKDYLKDVAFDPGRKHSLVWQSGFTGIAYNVAYTGRELTSVEDLFDPEFAGHMTMLDDMRGTLTLVMLALGRDPANATVDDARAAIEKIQETVDSGQLRRFNSNDYGAELTRGDVWVAVAWSGDIVQLQLDNPDLRWLFPEEGFELFTDNMVIPKGAQHKKTAETYMNFYYRPEIQAQVEAYIQYIPPVKAELVKPEIEKIDPALGESPLIFPSDEVLAKAKVFKPLDEDEERQVDEMFAELIGA